MIQLLSLLVVLTTFTSLFSEKPQNKDHSLYFFSQNLNDNDSVYDTIQDITLYSIKDEDLDHIPGEDASQQKKSETKRPQKKDHFYGCFFSHGLGGSAAQGDWYAGFYGIGDGSIVVPRLIPYELFSFNYREVLDGVTDNITLGQEDEIEIFNTAFNRAIENIKNRGYQDHQIHLILCGVSRGASTILNWMSRHPESLHYVAGVILESPFDSVENVFGYLVSQMKALKYFVPTGIIKWLVKRVACGSYDENGIQPLHAVNNIAKKNIPILFVWSKTDTIISYKNSENLYLRLRKNGHSRVEYLECDRGCHGGILWGPEGNKYKKAVEKFLARIVR